MKIWVSKLKLTKMVKVSPLTRPDLPQVYQKGIILMLSNETIDLISSGLQTGVVWEGGKWRCASPNATVWYIALSRSNWPTVTEWRAVTFHVIVEVGFWSSAVLYCQFETMSTPTNSPDHLPIQPLHNPSLAAQVILSQALIDNGSIAPLAKKGWVLHVYACRNDTDGRTSNLTFCSPTDNLLTPCTRKLSAARKKHFNKYAILITWTCAFWLIFLFRPPKTVQLFPQAENNESKEEELVSEQVAVPTEKKMEDDDENPF